MGDKVLTVWDSWVNGGTIWDSLASWDGFWVGKK